MPTVRLRQLLYSVESGFYEGDIPGGVCHPAFEQPLSHDCFGVVQEPQKGPFLTAVVRIPQNLQLPACVDASRSASRTRLDHASFGRFLKLSSISLWVGCSGPGAQVSVRDTTLRKQGFLQDQCCLHEQLN